MTTPDQPRVTFLPVSKRQRALYLITRDNRNLQGIPVNTPISHQTHFFREKGPDFLPLVDLESELPAVEGEWTLKVLLREGEERSQVGTAAHL